MLNNIKARVMEHVPSSLNPENQYAKSFAALLCLIVSADGTYEPDEFMEAAQAIESDETLRKLSMVQRCSEYFGIYCNRANQLMADRMSFPSFQTDLISEVREIKVPHNMQLQGLIDLLYPSLSTPERNVIARLGSLTK